MTRKRREDTGTPDEDTNWRPVLVKAEQMAALRKTATRDGRCLVCGQPKPKPVRG
jgi:hypothetical protein